jgi:hypothetical protein
MEEAPSERAQTKGSELTKLLQRNEIEISVASGEIGIEWAKVVSITPYLI